MSTKHTPGPWRLDGPENKHVVAPDYHVIEGGRGYLDDDGKGFRVCGCISLADARLMTTAPDMLDVLKMAAGFDLPAEVLAAVDAVIEKAEG